tara:strand:+ start:251 stop:805 length:555 start_codon:yes stop_codon:yes gene_type:complete
LEIQRIEIPQIKIKEIYIPKTRTWSQYPTTLDIINKPSLEYPVINLPSFEPLEYHPDKFIPTDPEKKPEQKKPDIPQPPKYIPKVKKDKEFFIKCPNESNIPVGSYPNELRLQIVIGHSVKNGQCYEIYRDSSFTEKWFPSPPVLVSTSIIAVAAASSPIIVNLLKNLIKTAIKKLTKKKNEVK